MTTKLDGNLRRELLIGKVAYTLTLSPTGFTLALKGRRKGLDIAWDDLVGGDAALATALNASLVANIVPPVEVAAPPDAKKPEPERKRSGKPASWRVSIRLGYIRTRRPTTRPLGAWRWWVGAARPQNQIIIVFEQPHEMVADDSFEGGRQALMVSKWYSNSLGPKANLRMDLSWRRGGEFDAGRAYAHIEVPPKGSARSSTSHVISA